MFWHEKLYRKLIIQQHAKFLAFCPQKLCPLWYFEPQGKQSWFYALLTGNPTLYYLSPKHFQRYSKISRSSHCKANQSRWRRYPLAEWYSDQQILWWTSKTITSTEINNSSYRSICQEQTIWHSLINRGVSLWGLLCSMCELFYV